jgi:hypothetical protein
MSPSIPKLNLTGNFVFSAVRPDHLGVTPPPVPPPLGPLAAFVGDFTGQGFNTIFRPENSVTPTPLPVPFPNSDNILELNLTSETLSFSPSLGAIPNRGTTPQPDINLNGVPYLQKVNDITIHGESVGIHFEPGIWIHIPATTVPPQKETVARMASIPHGTTIEAQGTFVTIAGPPTIPSVDMTPFAINPPHNKIKFPSQNASDPKTPRIPQDLSSFIAAGTITQAILDDPNSLLRAHISKQKITQTTTIDISTAPPPVPLGGGTDNIAFLQPNALAAQMSALFWIETVEEKILVPPHLPGHPPHLITAKASVPGQKTASFSVTPPVALNQPREITVHFTQIQYTQRVMLNFKGLTWPHISVNTLVPADHIDIPPSSPVWG